MTGACVRVCVNISATRSADATRSAHIDKLRTLVSTRAIISVYNRTVASLCRVFFFFFHVNIVVKQSCCPHFIALVCN